MFDKDKVRIKVWKQAGDGNNANKKLKTSEKNTKVYNKTKKCLFMLYHPQGCLLTSESCSYKHNDDE
jgi:hypothetical protein